MNFKLVKEKNIVSVNGKAVAKLQAEETKQEKQIRLIRQADKVNVQRRGVLFEHFNPNEYEQRDIDGRTKAIERINAAKKALELAERAEKIKALRAEQSERLQAAAARGRAK